jgi:DNA-binding MarR family transcriptional regulator
MKEPQSNVELNALPEIDQVIHTPTRLKILVYLYVVDSLDYVFLQRMTGLPWGSLATHVNKLEEAGYISIEKGYQGKKPHTMIRMTEQGRNSFREYKDKMQELLSSLPD